MRGFPPRAIPVPSFLCSMCVVERSTYFLSTCYSVYAVDDESCIVADESSECPNWYYCPPGSHHCQCGPALQGGIMCSVYFRVDFIMT